MGWWLDAARKFFRRRRRRRPPSRVCLQYKTPIERVYKAEAAIFSSKKETSLFRRKVAPAGAPGPITLLLRRTLSGYKATPIVRSQKIRMSYLREKSPRGRAQQQYTY